MSVLPPIDPAGRSQNELNELVERVIEAEVARLGDPRLSVSA